MNEAKLYNPSDEDLDAIMRFVADSPTLSTAMFGPFMLLSAVPNLRDDDIRALIDRAVSLGFFRNADCGRIQITLEGFRRAESARYRLGQTSRLPFEWSQIPAFSLADAVLVHANRTQPGKNIFIEDLYVDFATTPLGVLEHAVQELRDAGYFRAPNEERRKMLARMRFARDHNLDWVSGTTADGVRRAFELEGSAKIMPDKVTESARKFVQSMASLQSSSEHDVEAMLRAVPRALRELDSNNRRTDKQPFVVDDEYDLQDFIRAMLRVRFPALVAEDALHTVAGDGGRVDFHLKDEHVFIEIKFLRNISEWKAMSKDIAWKIQHYGQQPGCDVLFIFVHDPDSRLTNAEAIERDRTQMHMFGNKKVDVRLIVAPKQ